MKDGKVINLAERRHMKRKLLFLKDDRFMCFVDPRNFPRLDPAGLFLKADPPESPNAA